MALLTLSRPLASTIPEGKRLNDKLFYMQACKPPLEGLMAPSQQYWLLGQPGCIRRFSIVLVPEQFTIQLLYILTCCMK